MSGILIRCSSLGKIMTEAKSIDQALLDADPELAAAFAKTKRSDAEKALVAAAKARTMSDTAKTHIRELAAQAIFGVDFEFSSKETEKGIECEPDAIALVNRVRGLSLAKNTERRDDGFITGECDLFDAPRREGRDIKCSWSVKTFPVTLAAAEDDAYLWQARGYTKLWGADRWHIDYCLLDTPERLIGYEPQTMHFVSHVPEHMRVTTWTIERDPAIEDRIVERVKAARLYYAAVVAEFDRMHPAEVREAVA